MNASNLTRRSARGATVLLMAMIAGMGPPAVGAESEKPVAPKGSNSLEDRQSILADQFRELERSLLRLADLLASSDPRRSALLRRAFEQSDDLDIDARLASIVGLLKDGQLIKAGSAQGGAIENMRLLLELLESGESDRRIANTKEEVKRYLARLAKAIAKQRDIEGSTESGGDPSTLAERQEALAEETRSLGEDIDAFARRNDARSSPSGKEAGEPNEPGKGKDNRPDEGAEPKEKPSEGESSEAESGEGSPPDSGDEGDDESSRARRTRKRLDAATKRMQAAKERLDKANRNEARTEQEKALEELETARAELEEILRQLREEEVERLLVQLESRLRAMLRTEKGVLAGCDKLASTDGTGGAEDPSAGQARERELEIARLAREQAAVASDAGRALVMVRDDGSAVAIPEALEQVRLDGQQVAARLTRGDASATTRSIVVDIVTSLEEMLAALEKANREKADEKQKGQGGGRPAQPGEQPLVDKLSELKMIRTLQMRINTRTKRFSQLLTDGVEQAEEPELREAVARLSERQFKVEKAARDIATGRTE